MWTVQELQELLAHAQSEHKYTEQDVSDMANDMEFEGTMSKMGEYTEEILSAELARAAQMRITTLRLSRYDYAIRTNMKQLM
jgi:DNA-binding TFAR19-related protein (PDSD5 family)